MTKLAVLAAIALTACSSSVDAFSTSGRVTSQHASSTSLNLFGSKPKDPNSDAPQQPGMMDQLAMFKKAQEIASKKAAIDKELAEEKIVGTSADGKIEVTVQYIPPQMPANPTPGYEASDVNIDADYLADVSPEDLSTALVEAIRAGEQKAAERVGEKYKSLEADIQGIMGGMAAPGGAPPQ